MRPEAILGVSAVVVVVAVGVGLLVVPGAITPPGPAEGEPLGRLAIREVSIAPGPVSGASATLVLDTRLTHRGGDVRNVTVEYRAVDLQSGLVKATRRVRVGAVRREGERRLTTNLSVPRSGGYRIEVRVFRGARRVASSHREVRGVGSLVPAYADVPIDFHDFDTGAPLPPIEYSVASAESGKVTLDVSAYLTNEGDRLAGDVRLALIARQSDSGIVADRATLQVGEIRPGRTATPSAALTVPDGYNYYLDAVLTRDGVIVDTARSSAVLNPNRSITVNRSEGEGGLQVGDFERTEPGAGDRDETPTPAEATEGGGGPGFGAGVAVVAILMAAIAGRRYHD